MITRENAKKLLPIIKAYSEGKKVQFFNDREEWEDRERLSFDSETHKYRIKPEPKFRPFKNVEECWEEMQKHQPFGYIKYKDRNSYFPTGFGDNLDFDYLFKTYTFADGAPYGIKEEE